jgi:hypothetical protein
MNEELDVIGAITGDEFENSVILTYNCSLLFYETLLFRELWSKGCYNNSIIMDKKQYEELINKEMGLVSRCGSYYTLGSISASKAFHPKMILLTSKTQGRLLIGSGNTTYSGYANNFELFFRFDFHVEKGGNQDIFRQADTYLALLADRFPLDRATQARIARLREKTPWLKDNAEPSPERFLHNLDQPILDQILEQIKEEPKEIVLSAPFFDPALLVLRRLLKQYPQSSITVLTQSGYTNFPINTFLKEKEVFSRVRIHKIEPPADSSRSRHGKFLYFKTQKQEWLYAGSPNISFAALLSTVTKGNAEAGILINGKNLNRLWEKDINPQPVQTQDDLGDQISFGEANSSNSDLQISIHSAVFEQNRLVIEYSSNIAETADVIADQKVISQETLDHEGSIAVPLSQLLKNGKIPECLVVSLKVSETYSNSVWVNSMALKKTDDYSRIEKKVEILASELSDMAPIRAIFKYTSSFQIHQSQEDQFFKQNTKVNQEDGEAQTEEQELPKEYYYVEEKPLYLDSSEAVAGSASSSDKNRQLLEALLDEIGRPLHDITHHLNHHSTGEQNHHTAQDEETTFDSIDEGLFIRKKLNELIEKATKKTIHHLTAKDRSIHLEDALKINQRLGLLAWFFRGLQIQQEDVRVHMNCQDFLECSIIALERLWVKKEEGDKWSLTDLSADERGCFLSLSFCFFSFQLWVLHHECEMSSWVTDMQKRVIRASVAFLEEARPFQKDILQSQILGIAEELIDHEGFQFDMSFEEVIEQTPEEDDILSALGEHNRGAKDELADSKRQELKNLQEEREIALQEYHALQTNAHKHVLELKMSEQKFDKIEQKILEAERCLRQQPEESDEQKRQIKLPEAVKRYFQIQ